MTITLFLFFLCLGACVGSFLTMLTHRLPKKEDIVFKRSHCPHCGAYLQPKSLIPIISYFLQKGKCLNCGEKIGIRYPLIEIINTIAYITIFLCCKSLIGTIFLCLLFSVVLAIIIVDLENMEVPTYMQVALIFLAILNSLINYNLDPLFAIFSSFIYFIVAEFARICVEKLKKSKEVLGGADTKLIALCGLFLSIKQLHYFLLLTGIFGILFGIGWRLVKKEERFPFAPAIVISLFLIVSVKFYL